ncbi:MAG: TonB-dependent receptor family protein, partial [Gelidibacter sp.]|nr:TonB-dependent receptor family protein [Gelidibacter sp.]
QDDLLMGDIIGNLNLSAFKLDYNFNNEDFGTFSTGVKVSNVKNDNDLFYTNLIDDEIVINEALTNHFIYKENIQAAYLDWKKQIDKWSLQVGLRAENTQVEGNQLLSGDNFEQNYLQWFPTAFIQYQKDDNNTFGFNTGRRINRPNYGQLNPFRFFVDINTFRSGNPRLQPEKTWNFEFSYNYKSFLDLALSYSTTKDNILFVIQQNDETRTTNVLPVNIGLYNYFGLNISTQIKFWSWWNNRMNVELFYNEFLGDVAQYDLNNKAFAFRINGNSSLKFTNNFTGEISYFYQPKYQYGISDFNPRWRIDLALQQKILKGDGRIRLAVTDIFYKHSPTGATNFGNINETFESLRDTRVVTIGFQYNFGNSNLKSTKKETDAAKEELQRIG